MTATAFFKKYYLRNLKKLGVSQIQLRLYIHQARGLFSESNELNPSKLITVKLENSTIVIKALEKEFGNKIGIAMTSTVKIGALKKHLFLMDLKLKNSQENFTLLQKKCRDYKISIPILSGAKIFKTTNSYHLINTNILLSKKDWVYYMATSLLWQINKQDYNIVDTRCVGHSLIKGYFSLRINKYQNRDSPKLLGKI